MAVSIGVKIDGIDRIHYEAQTGVVVGSDFLSKERFRQWFEELLGQKNSKEYGLFAAALEQEINRMNSIGE
jgi:hypothetical protein